MTEPSDYDQGRAAGRQDQSIADHARRLDAINGSIGKSATALNELTEAVNLMRAEEKARRQRAEHRARYFALSVSAFLALLAAINLLRGLPF